MTNHKEIGRIEDDFGELILRKSWAELSAAERQEFGEYVSDGEEYDRIRSLLVAAVSSKDSDTGPGMPAIVRDELLDMFDRERAIAVGRESSVRRLGSSRHWWLTGAAAAAVLLMVASVWWVMQRPGLIEEAVKPAEMAQQMQSPPQETIPPAAAEPAELRAADGDYVRQAEASTETIPVAEQVSKEPEKAESRQYEQMITPETTAKAGEHTDEIAVASKSMQRDVAISYADVDQQMLSEEDFTPVKQIRGTRELPAKPIPTHKGSVPSMSRPVSEDRQLISFLFECR